MKIKTVLHTTSLWALLLGLIFHSSIAIAASESAVKVAYVYSIMKFIKWQDKGNITLCHTGSAESLRTLSGKQASGKRISLKSISSASQAGSCSLVYIKGLPSSQVSSYVALKSKGIITISDMNGFIDKGGMIGFRRAGKKLKFEINHTAIKQSGNKVSSKVLAVAARVI